MRVICAVFIASLLAACAVPADQLATCKVKVERVDAMGVRHIDCALWEFPAH